MIFIVASIIYGIKLDTFKFNKKNTLSFLKYSAFFLILIISAFYSSNQTEAFKRLVQLSPLFLVPFLICFNKYSFTNTSKLFALQVFTLANIIYTFLIVYVYFTNDSNINFSLKYFLSDYDKFQIMINQNVHNDLPFVHKAYFSMGFVICAIFCLNQAMKFFSKNKFYFGLYITAFIYFFSWIFYAFSFPNVIALIISILALLFYELKTKHFLIGLFLLIVPVFFIIFIKAKDIDVRRGFNFITSMTQNKEIETNDTRREIYKSYNLILKTSSVQQLLFGHGVGDVQDELNRVYSERYADLKSTNLLLYNEEFNDLFWFKNNIEVKPNIELAIDNKLTADFIHETYDKKQKSSHNISTKIKIDQKGSYTFSVFAKQEANNHLILRLGNIDQRAVFDLSQGKVMYKSNLIESSITSFKNGWYRCSITVELVEDTLAIIGLTNNQGDYLYFGDGKGLYIWGAQIEEGTLTNYIKNEAELLLAVKEEELNSHNNYLYFLLATGAIGFIAFCGSLLGIFAKSIRQRDIQKLTFCITIALNFLTENILLRHWGLMFISFMLLLMFLETKQDSQV